MPGASKTVLLLHGWQGGPKSFGGLPRLLEAEGHTLLPLFTHYETWPRRRTLEELAARLEEALRRRRGAKDPPLVLITHSMGGLLARAWMLRHHAEQGRRPPVERVIECSVPRHGVMLEWAGRTFVQLGWLPGAALARQMQAPNPFLWDLAWSEARHAQWLPPVHALAGLSRPGHPVAFLAGGKESDGVVPAVFSQPGAVFARPGQPTMRLGGRPFRIFQGFSHHRPRGLLRHLAAGADGRPKDPNDPVWTMLRSCVNGEAPEHPAAPGQDAAQALRRALVFARHAAASPPLFLDDGERREKPWATHPEGLALFGLSFAKQGAERKTFQLRYGQPPESGGAKSWQGEAGPGEVLYVDLRAAPRG